MFVLLLLNCISSLYVLYIEKEKHIYNGILFIHEKEGNVVICDNLDEILTALC